MKSKAIWILVIMMMLSAAAGCANTATGPEEKKDLVWDEEAMFGLKQPDGVIVDRLDEFSGCSYILKDMTEDEVAATIQQIKDLGFTENPVVTNISYLGHHEEDGKQSLYIVHYKNQFMDEVTISSFRNTLDDSEKPLFN